MRKVEGKPVNSTSVPSVSSAQLLVYGGSRINSHVRIAKEIEDKKRRGDLIVPDDPSGEDWQLTVTACNHRRSGPISSHDFGPHSVRL
jgi:hypothetical protein